jgi:DNA-directed RNA polymerase specialized sigma24 family protein
MVQRLLKHRLSAWALAHGHRGSGDAIHDAITDTVVTALAPGCFDPAKGDDPLAWIFTIAQNNLRNRWRANRARPQLDSAGLDVIGPTSPVAFADPVERAEARRELQRRIREVSSNPGEARFLALRYLHEGPVAEQAAALGGEHLPPPEQQTLVNLAVKRLAKRGRLRRCGRSRPSPSAGD